MNRKSIIRIVVEVAVVVAVIVVTQALKSPKEEEEVQPIRPVKTLRIEDSPTSVRRTFPGQLQASQTIDLAFLYGGDMSSFPVQEGQRINEGVLIAALDDRDAQSNLNSAAADLNLARAELDRNRTLYEEELISVAEFDIKRRGYNVAYAAYDRAEKAVEDRQIRAPFSGIIAKRFVENYEKVQPGQKVVTFIDPEGLDITINLPETFVSQLPDFNYTFSAVFEQNSGISYPLEVKEFATIADTYTKTYAVTLYMPRPKDITVLPDMTVTVHIDVTRKDEVDVGDFLVPITAIVYDIEDDSSVIWVVEESSDPMIVNPRTVVAERALSNEVVVRDGLKDGDLIVIAGGGFLNRDQPVRIFEQ